MGTNPIFVSTRRLADRLRRENISHAIMGSMAVCLHGGQPLKEDVVVLLTSEGLGLFERKVAGKLYDPVPKHPRRFVEKESGTTTVVMLTGHFPGKTSPGPFPFPHPDEVGKEIDGIRVVALPDLIQLKLAARSFHESAAVVSLIQANNLDEAFSDKLHPSVRDAYLACVEETRREEEFLIHNG
jgi:hypothetical protein